jgi:hopene-associated glycosyltransferase HpnB
MAWLTIIAALPLLAWLYLVLLRGGYWRAAERLPDPPAVLEAWPDVVAVVPARDEADAVGEAIASILSQDYAGRLDAILVDDHSSDGTGEAAATAAARAGRERRLTVIQAADLPSGWSGKVWAQAQGMAHADAHLPEARYVWLADADIAHGPETLRRLVAKAEAERRDLVSLMALLSCASAWERLLIPPFVYFFQMLYPFAWVNDPRRRTAAAAGGCMLVRREALARAGGLAAIKGALIDDCALARAIKKDGAIWLGLTETTRSIRPYQGLGDIWRMVARSAYTQLRHAPILLAGTLVGMALVYLAPPLALLSWPWHGRAEVAIFGGLAWAMMTLSAVPTYRLYGLAPWRAATLPLAAALYASMTFDSAWRHWRGRGGAWKGRTHQGRGALERTGPDL